VGEVGKFLDEFIGRGVTMDTQQAMPETNNEQEEQLSAETLVVVSKVKGFIRSHAGLNTSRCAIDALTKKVAGECLRGIENAKTAGRKTVMGKDIL
jgi:hypothetical protein